MLLVVQFLREGMARGRFVWMRGGGVDMCEEPNTLNKPTKEFKTLQRFPFDTVQLFS
jgi:hypothetical protein